MSDKFLSWHLRRSFLIAILNFLLGFLTAWLLAADTFRYVFFNLFR